MTHLIICDDRDHFVNIQSERHSIVCVSVYFEPELTLRQLRGRVGSYSPALACISQWWGIILGDFNICAPEEGRCNVWNQTFIDGDPGKTAVFHTFFPHVFEVAQSDYKNRLYSHWCHTHSFKIRTLSRIVRIFPFTHG